LAPLQSLIDEMEFNIEVTRTTANNQLGCKFHHIEFDRVISEGLLSLLSVELRDSLVATYRRIGQLNSIIEGILNTEGNTSLLRTRFAHMGAEMPLAADELEQSKSLLVGFLTEED